MSYQTKKQLRVIAALFLAAIAAGPAWGATTTCTVSTSSVNFGVYNARSGAALDGVGSITISCNQPPSATLLIGSGGSPTFYQRRMASGANILEYNLFIQSARTGVWGEGGASGTFTVPITASGTYTVYGRVFGGQKVPVGSYGDTLVVTLMY